MQSIFDERLWLAWLVKVRIIILTLLFGIELAIARLTPNPFPLRLFIDVDLCCGTRFRSFYLLLFPSGKNAASSRCCKSSPTC